MSQDWNTEGYRRQIEEARKTAAYASPVFKRTLTTTNRAEFERAKREAEWRFQDERRRNERHDR